MVGLEDASDGGPRRVSFHLSRHSLAGYLLETGTESERSQAAARSGRVRAVRDMEPWARGDAREGPHG